MWTRSRDLNGNLVINSIQIIHIEVLLPTFDVIRLLVKTSTGHPETWLPSRKEVITVLQLIFGQDISSATKCQWQSNSNVCMCVQSPWGLWT